ncbi:MAG: Formyltetrahydrofolate deformylase [Candidatus Hydrogenedentes bacterium ADurb.Bin179]|nr:MAG: Formyltetrahydrofolate deformylase [Candidatus Hydrogenedentes bacterium ADurb.Bin179]
METAVLKLHCRDMKGIVYNVSRYLFECGANIINAEQHAEAIDNRFFMRVYFDCAGLNRTREEFHTGLARLADEFGMETHLSFSDRRKRMAVMVSKYDHCLYDLLLRHQYGEINADFALIVSNHRTLEPVAETFGVPFFYAPVTAETKDASENKALDLFQAHRVDFIVLARYMQILSETFISRYQHRIINVHHGLLPAFKGARPYHQAYEHGVKIIGATSHYATADLDMGPIIEQQTVRVDHTHSEETLVAMGRDIERNVLSAAVKAHADDRIMVYRRRTIVFR